MKAFCTECKFLVRPKQITRVHVHFSCLKPATSVQRNTSTLIEGNNTPFIDSRLKTLEFQLYIVLLQLFELNSSNVSMLQSFSEDYMSFNFCISQKTVMMSSFHCTHDLVSMFYFHTFI